MAPDPNHHCYATERLTAVEKQLGELQRELAQLRGRSKQHRPERATRKKEVAPSLPKARNRSVEREGVQLRTVRRRVDAEKRHCACGCNLVTDVRQVENTVTELVPARIEKVTYLDEVITFACGRRVTSEQPVKVTDGGDYGPALVADVIVSKCEESTPITRQAKRFTRMGLPMARSTLTDLFHQGANALVPIYRHALSLLALQELVLADETSMRVQAPGKCRTGYMWTFVTSLVVTYCFRPSRSGRTPRELLGKPSKVGQTLLVDGHTGYNAVTKVDGWRRAGCQAHGRRRFFDAEGEEADEALEFFRALYRVEHHAAERGIKGTPEHLQLRRTVGLAYFREFHRWLIRKRGSHPPSTQLGNAIRYALKNRATWMHIFRDAKIPLDNNASESALRVVALLRKNALFLGHDESGENHAVLMTLIATCKLHGVNPVDYLRDVLLRVQTHPASRIHELLPHHWKLTHVV